MFLTQKVWSPLSEFLATFWTIVGFLAAVDSHVARQMRCGAQLQAANGALL